MVTTNLNNMFLWIPSHEGSDETSFDLVQLISFPALHRLIHWCILPVPFWNVLFSWLLFSCQVVSNSVTTPWTVQAPLSMGFPRQEYFSGLPFPSLGDPPDPAIEPRSPALQTDALPSEPPGKPGSKHLLISWLQSPSAVILDPQKNKVWDCFHCFSLYFPWSDRTGCHDLRFLNVEL